jgi:hypothetical protein
MDYLETDMVAHHVRTMGGGGMGLKPSDLYTIPLTAYEHARLHAGVEGDYYRRHDLDIQPILVDLMRRFIRNKMEIPIGDNLELYGLMEMIILNH